MTNVFCLQFSMETGHKHTRIPAHTHTHIERAHIAEHIVSGLKPFRKCHVSHAARCYSCSLCPFCPSFSKWKHTHTHTRTHIHMCRAFPSSFSWCLLIPVPQVRCDCCCCRCRCCCSTCFLLPLALTIVSRQPDCGIACRQRGSGGARGSEREWGRSVEAKRSLAWTHWEAHLVARPIRQPVSARRSTL